MACFYAMHELDVPFRQDAILGRYCEKEGETKLPTLGVTVPEWGEPQGDQRHHQFFTLRVCKRCRADWMDAIESWFKTPVCDDESCGTGIYVRDRGAIREITIDAWEDRNK
jgi:hypothetical protein